MPPVADRIVPALQLEHTLSPDPVANRPAGQSTHAFALDWPVSWLNLPGPHRTHWLLPVVGW